MIYFIPSQYASTAEIRFPVFSGTGVPFFKQHRFLPAFQSYSGDIHEKWLQPSTDLHRAMQSEGSSRLQSSGCLPQVPSIEISFPWYPTFFWRHDTGSIVKNEKYHDIMDF